MIGLPKILQTRLDYDRVLQMAIAGECSKEKAIRSFTGLLESRWSYEFDRTLIEGESPDGDEPEYVVIEPENNNPEEEPKARQQLRKTEQPNARIFQLGYSVDEVEHIISDLEYM